QRLQPALAERNIRATYWFFLKFHNRPWDGEFFDCQWPRELTGDELVDEYIRGLRERCEGKTFRPRIFRPDGVPRKERFFSSADGRAVVERAFLRAGANIVSWSQQQKAEIRPLGYEKLESLGFGALFVSYRNIPNNCPLALWWGDPDSPPEHP